MNISLIENNYIYIPEFISESRAKAIASNFKHHCLENNNTGDNQAPNSLTDYNFIDFLELLCERTPLVSEILQETVLPTYSYARVYKDGSVLDRHRDRDACEISLTIHLDGDKEWPIYIQTPKGEEVELNLQPGDAMMYLGCDADHWRKQFTGTEYIQVFLHYVKSRGNKAYTYFDKVKDKDKDKPKKLIDNNDKKSEQPESIKTFYKKNLNDYIIVLENILSDELCYDIICEFKNSDEWAQSTVGYGQLDSTIRNVNEIGISIAEVIGKNSSIRQSLDDKIFVSAGLAIKKYNETFPTCRIEADTGYQLLKYDTGQFYLQHTDSYKLNPRAVSCSFILNDDYEGGEFAFFDRELKYKLKKGSAILFPSNFMYPHEIMPVTKGTRYSIITWFI